VRDDDVIVCAKCAHEWRLTFRNTAIKKCSTASEAQVEIERLMAAITGFEGCKVVKVTREDDPKLGCWTAKIDDPADEFEYHSFTIFDDGDADWD